MNTDEFAARIRAEYPSCTEATAESIANKAQEYEAEMDTEKTVEEWLSFMQDSDQDRAVTAWNWAIGYVDPTNWDRQNPYKLQK